MRRRSHHQDHVLLPFLFYVQQGDLTLVWFEDLDFYLLPWKGYSFLHMKNATSHSLFFAIVRERERERERKEREREWMNCEPKRIYLKLKMLQQYMAVRMMITMWEIEVFYVRVTFSSKLRLKGCIMGIIQECIYL